MFLVDIHVSKVERKFDVSSFGGGATRDWLVAAGGEHQPSKPVPLFRAKLFLCISDCLLLNPSLRLRRPVVDSVCVLVLLLCEIAV